MKMKPSGTKLVCLSRVTSAVDGKCIQLDYAISTGSYLFWKQITVPVGCDHQVQRVPGVLSTENVSPHMYRVRTIEKRNDTQGNFGENVVLVIFRPK